MSGTRRTPIGRPPGLQITPRAIELFVAAEKARKQRRTASCGIPDMHGYCKMECRPCKAWWKAQTALCDELKLPPWRWPAIPCCPFPPSSMRAGEWEPDGDEKLELWQQLERARRAAGRRRLRPQLGAAAPSPPPVLK